MRVRDKPCISVARRTVASDPIGVVRDGAVPGDLEGRSVLQVVGVLCSVPADERIDSRTLCPDTVRFERCNKSL